MPNHKSCEKRVRTSSLQRLRNRSLRSQLRATVKELHNLKSWEEADRKYREVSSLYDIAARNGIVHKRNADRNKSRLARFVQTLA
ncbi:MAG: 30S ribosomal protein S20 [candidate division Zixibacteria bacterium]|nr:30S ribosomal protein S20 [candidate division Zixibacteria bacterium]